FVHSRGRRTCKHLALVEARPDLYACIEPGLKAVVGPTVDASPGLFTIGHSNHPIENFLSLLGQHHIRAVIDVRSKPYSQYSPHFCRDALRRSVRAKGIDYYWAGKELGGRDKVSIDSAPFHDRMTQIVEMATRMRIALMCSEGKPQDCHRTWKLIAWVHHKVQGYARHILTDGTLLSSEILAAKLGDDGLWFEFGGSKGQ
ncbi:hypothetical protein LCGC14_1682740, partial [marine sediment metagenome]